MRQIITCKTEEQLLDICLGLVMRGMTFEADYDRLEVKLLGGY